MDPWNVVRLLVVMLLSGAPAWLPLVFIAYAFGRKKFSLLWLFAFVTSEAIALAVWNWFVANAMLYF